MELTHAQTLVKRLEERWPGIRLEAGELARAAAERLAGAIPPPGWADLDFALASAVCAGDRQAWAVFYEQYHAAIYRIMRRHAASGEDAATICQDFCTEAPERLKPYSGRCSLQGWLAAVAPNVVRDWYRRRRKEVSLEACAASREDGAGLPPLEPEGLDGEAARERVERAADQAPCHEMLRGSLREAWQRLEGEERVLLEYKFFHGLKSREIGAVILKVREDVVSKRLKRALASLGRLLRRLALARYNFSHEDVGHCAELLIGRLEPGLLE